MAPVVRTDASGRALTPFCVRATGTLKEKLRARGARTSRTIWVVGWDEAQGERAKIVDEWNRVPRPEDVVHTGDELAAKFLAVKGRGKARKSTVAGYAERLTLYFLPYFGARDLATITPDDIDAWTKKHNTTGSSRTRQARLGTLAEVFRFGEAYKWMTSPVRPEHAIHVLKVGHDSGGVIGDERIARALSPEEIATIVAELDEDDPALRMMIRLMAWTGWRSREALHVRLSDVTLGGDGSAFVTVASGFPCPCGNCAEDDGVRKTKSSKSRLVPIHSSLVKPLTEFLTQHQQYFASRLPTPWLFPTWCRRSSSHASIGGIRTAESLRRAFQAAAKRAGFTGLVVHDTRSSAKTSLKLIPGSNADAIDYALGHAPRTAMDAVYVKYEQAPGLLYRAVFPGVLPPVTLVPDQPAPVMSNRLMVASR